MSDFDSAPEAASHASGSVPPVQTVALSLRITTSMKAALRCDEEGLTAALGTLLARELAGPTPASWASPPFAAALAAEPTVHVSCRLPVQLLDAATARASLFPLLTWIRDALARQLIADGRLAFENGVVVVRSPAEAQVQAQAEAAEALPPER